MNPRPSKMSWAEMVGIASILTSVWSGYWHFNGWLESMDKRLSVLEQRIDDLHSSYIQGSVRPPPGGDPWEVKDK